MQELGVQRLVMPSRWTLGLVLGLFSGCAGGVEPELATPDAAYAPTGDAADQAAPEEAVAAPTDTQGQAEADGALPRTHVIRGWPAGKEAWLVTSAAALARLDWQGERDVVPEVDFARERLAIIAFETRSSRCKPELGSADVEAGTLTLVIEHVCTSPLTADIVYDTVFVVLPKEPETVALGDGRALRAAP